MLRQLFFLKKHRVNFVLFTGLDFVRHSDYSLRVYYRSAPVGGSAFSPTDFGALVVDYTPPIIDAINEAKQITARQPELSAYPNPFNAATKIRFRLTQPDRVRLDVYDLLGRKIKTLHDEQMPDGNHEILWGGENDTGNMAASSVYVVVMQTGNSRVMQKIVMLK